MLSGQIRDQAALYGIIAKVRDLGLFLNSVKWIAGESTKENSKEISASEDDGTEAPRGSSGNGDSPPSGND